MTSSMKQRIAQIRHGQVPKGYQLTRCGIVPGDWAELCLGDIYTERNEPGNENLPLLMVSIHSGVSDGEVDEEQLPKKVKRIADKTRYKRAASGDLAFNMMRAWQGAIGTVRTEGMVSPAYIVAVPNDKVDPLFMDYYVKMERTIQYIHRQSYGVTDFRLRLYWDSFISIPCVLPPLAEQRKIAKILAAQDRVIELKKKLLEETKRRKKALVRMLMESTGLKRLEAASPRGAAHRGEAASCRFVGTQWRKVKLGDLFSFGNGYTPSTAAREYWDGGTIPWFRMEDIRANGRILKDSIQHVTPKAVKKTGLFPAGSFILSTTATIGEYALLIADSLANQQFTFLIKNVNRSSEVDTMYFLQYLAVISKWCKKTANAGGLLAVNIDDLSAYEFLLPPLAIQRQIAAILSAADREIDLLRQDIEQEKRKKKALMQLLLTGIVRVPIKGNKERICQ